MHILIIEDSQFFREQLETLLRKYIPGIESISGVESVSDATALLNSDHTVDLVITDTQIKCGHSIDVLCAVTNYDFDVVTMSMMDTRDYFIRSLLKAGFPFYEKVSDFEKLQELIMVGQREGRRKDTAGKIEVLREIKSEWIKQSPKEKKEIAETENWFSKIKALVFSKNKKNRNE